MAGLHGGVKYYREIYSNYFVSFQPVDLSNYEFPHGYCVVYSTSDRESFQQAKMYLQKLWTDDSISTKAVILVGNKTDLVRIRAVSFEGKSHSVHVYFLLLSFKLTLLL